MKIGTDNATTLIKKNSVEYLVSRMDKGEDRLSRLENEVEELNHLIKKYD